MLTFSCRYFSNCDIISHIVYILEVGEMMDFSKRLKKQRMKKKLTQEEFSNLLNIKRATYAKYETGENQPSYELLKEIATHFNVTTDYLLGFDKDMNEQKYPLIDSDMNDMLVKSDGTEYYPFSNKDEWDRLDDEDKEDVKKYIDWIAYKAQYKK